jgi:hypothetical protein
MLDASRPPVSAMEGKGFYNENAAIPTAGGALALPLFEQAARLIHLDLDDRPILSPTTGLRKARIRSLQCGLRSQFCDLELAPSGRFLCITPIFRTTT